MNTPNSVSKNLTTAEKSAALTPAAQKAWQVNFVTPAPKAMPSDRLQARAELVRKALSCGTY